MNQNVTTIVLALACGIGGGVAGAAVASNGAVRAEPPSEGVAPASTDAARIAALVERDARIERDLESMRLALADLSASQRSAAAVPTEVAAPAGEAAPAPASSAPTTASAIERLLAGGLDWDESQALWKQVADAGQLDEVLEMLEERAQARGNDPDAQTQLGLAYLQKVFRTGGGPEAGTWATKADRAFDAALAADENHWEARFQKAVSLSFWPPMLGKQPEAVKQFEKLVAQQEASGLKSKGFASTYLFLGNMHLQMNSKAQALATWNQGLAQFPNDPELLKQIAAVQ